MTKKESKRPPKAVQILVLFIALFIINILVFKTLSFMGLGEIRSERDFVIPPLFATAVLLFIAKRQGRK